MDRPNIFPGMKCYLTDGGTGVMLILRWSGGFEGGQVSDALVSQIDLFPTICELCEIDPPDWLQGRSLLPVVCGETDEVNDQVCAEVNYHCHYEPKRAVRTRRWKYIRRHAEYRYPMLANIDDSPSKSVWMAHGLAQRPVAAEELYDLVFDPNEAHNLADARAPALDPAQDAALAEMRQRLHDWMAATGDPLLEGPIPPPEGAAVSRPEDVSPGDVWHYTERREGLA